MNVPASFEVLIPGHETAEEVLGLWQVTSLETTSDGEIGSVWRADLPDDPLEAASALGAQAFHLRRARRALAAAQGRLQADLGVLAKPDGSVYSTGPALTQASLDSPRRVLETAAQLRWSDTSYGVLDRLKLDPLELEQARQAVSQFAGQVQRTVEQLALVETASGGRPLGATRVAWSGDAETWWGSSFGPEHYAQHSRVLAQALATRQDWLRFLLLLSSGAVRVAAVLATGPFSLLAIWTTWNYLKQVVAEYRQLRVNFPSISNS